MAHTEHSVSRFTALVLGLMACNPAYADRLAPVSAEPTMVAAPTVESPYQVDLIAETGSMLDVHQHRGRFYVLGAAGERYTIRVTNPTPRRVEAVVSVDGLDVIDGKTADLRKRGYVVPAYGELRIDGFRVSTQQVATFRFSSVSQSYAGRKGQARNVGVIGVAIFEEQGQPELVLSAPVPDATPRPRDYDYRNDLGDDKAGADAPAERSEAESAPSGLGSTAGSSGRGKAGGTTRSAPPRSAAKSSRADRSAAAPSPMTEESRSSSRCCGEPKKKERPGLGTEFGEQRGSAVTWTRFVRANLTVPTAMAELRYNDVAGLQALGIQITPPVDAAEVETRESASPFPGSFAEPPR